jgi:hypothetical protein
MRYESSFFEPYYTGCSTDVALLTLPICVFDFTHSGKVLKKAF